MLQNVVQIPIKEAHMIFQISDFSNGDTKDPIGTNQLFALNICSKSSMFSFLLLKFEGYKILFKIFVIL